MNAKDLLYYYSKEYLLYNIKATLMIENWTDKDWCSNYHKFMSEYIFLKNFAVKNNISDEKFKRYLSSLKENRLNFVYSYLFDNVIDRLKLKKGVISPERQNKLYSRLEKYRSFTDPDDFNYILELRKIEEEEY